MIEVQVKSAVRTRIDRSVLARAVEAALKGRFTRAFVSVAVIGPKRMRRMNLETLGHDYDTDVLSFDHGDSHEGRQIEIVVCATFARKQAQQLGIPLMQELARYVVHGCLHCAGFDDGTHAGRERMWHEQESVVRSLFGNAGEARSNLRK